MRNCIITAVKEFIGEQLSIRLKGDSPGRTRTPITSGVLVEGSWRSRLSRRCQKGRLVTEFQSIVVQPMLS